MMTVEENKLLSQDICARVPYGVKYMRYSWDYDMDQELPIIETLEYVDKDGFINYRRVYKVYDIKPYLFPLSSMTLEQMEELNKLLPNGMSFGYDTENKLYITISDTDEFYYLSIFMNVQQWLNKNHFDYRGLIQMGLALDATGKNIY